MSERVPSDRTKGGQFAKGRSGNLKGRPRKSTSPARSAFAVLDDIVRVLVGGQPIEMSRAEAIFRQQVKAAFANKRGPRRRLLRLIAERDIERIRRRKPPVCTPVRRRIQYDSAGAEAALLLLGITQAKVTNADHRVVQTWAVQAALGRNRRKLTDRDKSEIKRCTADADELRWPRQTERESG